MENNLYKMMLNIRGINVLNEVNKCIEETKKELNGLIYEQTCKIYNSCLFESMREHYLQVRLINTKLLGLNYEHYFVLVKNNTEYILADLTYKQFNNNNFTNLVNNGYMIVDDTTLNEYLSVIENIKVSDMTCDYLFYMEVNDKSR